MSVSHTFPGHEARALPPSQRCGWSEKVPRALNWLPALIDVDEAQAFPQLTYETSLRLISTPNNVTLRECEAEALVQMGLFFGFAPREGDTRRLQAQFALKKVVRLHAE